MNAVADRDLQDSERTRLDDIRKHRSEPCFVGQGSLGDDVRNARTVHRHIARKLLAQPGVVGVDVGFAIREKSFEFTGDVAVRVHVENKLTESQLKDAGRSSFSALLRNAAAKRNRPLVPGFSVEPEDSGPPSDTMGNESNEAPSTLTDTSTDTLEGDALATSKGAEVSEATAESGGESNDDAIATAHTCDTRPSFGFRPKCGRVVRLDVVEARYLPSAPTGFVADRRKSDPSLDDSDIQRLTRQRVDPVAGGTSIGTAAGPAGTLGAVVWDEIDGEPCILSNWHVLAGHPGARAGLKCFQPAVFDGGQLERDAVGELKRWWFDKEGDAALARLTEPRPYCSGEVLGLYSRISETIPPQLGMPVRSWGRTTGFTQGFIDGIDLVMNVPYSYVGTQRFSGQIHIAGLRPTDEVSALGDSGKLWVTRHHQVPPLSVDQTADAALDELGAVLDRGSTDDPSDIVEGAANAKGLEEETPEPMTAVENRDDDRDQVNDRVYYAVALHFAGDAAGSGSGEFAVASPICKIQEKLRFGFRPTYFTDSDQVVVPAPPPAVSSGAPPSLEGLSQPAYGGGSNGTTAEPIPRVPPP